MAYRAGVVFVAMHTVNHESATGVNPETASFSGVIAGVVLFCAIPKVNHKHGTAVNPKRGKYLREIFDSGLTPVTGSWSTVCMAQNTTRKEAALNAANIADRNRQAAECDLQLAQIKAERIVDKLKFEVNVWDNDDFNHWVQTRNDAMDQLRRAREAHRVAVALCDAATELCVKIAPEWF